MTKTKKKKPIFLYLLGVAYLFIIINYFFTIEGVSIFNDNDKAYTSDNVFYKNSSNISLSNYSISHPYSIENNKVSTTSGNYRNITYNQQSNKQRNYSSPLKRVQKVNESSNFQSIAFSGFNLFEIQTQHKLIDKNQSTSNNLSNFALSINDRKIFQSVLYRGNNKTNEPTNTNSLGIDLALNGSSLTSESLDESLQKGGIDPDGDPEGDPIPVGAGWDLMIIFAIMYAGWQSIRLKLKTKF